MEEIIETISEQLIPDVEKIFVIEGEPKEEFSAKDLLEQIQLLKGQIKKIDKANKDQQEMMSVMEEILVCTEKLEKLKAKYALEIEIPPLETLEEITFEEIVETPSIQEITTLL